MSIARNLSFLSYSLSGHTAIIFYHSRYGYLIMKCNWLPFEIYKTASFAFGFLSVPTPPV